MISQSKPFFRITPVRLIILLAILQLIVALFTNTLVFTHEESMWHYIGRNWIRHGLTPYDGGADNKSPLIYLIFGLSDSFFGINYWFPRLLGTIVEATGVYYLFRIAKQVAGDKAGIFALSIYGLSLLWKTTGGKLVSFTETYSCTCTIISFYYCLSAKKNKQYFISGLFAGLALAFRLTSVFGLLTVFILAIRRRRRMPALPLFITGTIVMGGLLTMAMLLAGINLPDIYHYMLADNFGAGSTTDHSLLWKLDMFTANFFNSELVLFYPFVTAYILIKKRIDWVIAWLIFSFIGINILGIYARSHFKELLPALSLASAFALAYASETYKISYKGLLVLVWICFFPKITEPLLGLRNAINYSTSVVNNAEGSTQASEEAEKLLGLWIRAKTKETDKVFVAGYGARVQVFSTRLSPTIFFNVTQTSEARQRLYRDLTLNKPDMLVIPTFTNYTSFVGADIRDFIARLAAQYYSRDTSLYSYTVYRLNH